MQRAGAIGRSPGATRSQRVAAGADGTLANHAIVAEAPPGTKAQADSMRIGRLADGTQPIAEPPRN